MKRAAIILPVLGFLAGEYGVPPMALLAGSACFVGGAFCAALLILRETA